MSSFMRAYGVSRLRCLPARGPVVDGIGVRERVAGTVRLVPKIGIERRLLEDSDARFLLENEAEEVRSVCIWRVRAKAQGRAAFASSAGECAMSGNRAKHSIANAPGQLEPGERVDPT